MTQAPRRRPGCMSGLDGFEDLVGSWSTTSTHPMLDGPVAGSVTWSWLDGGRFLRQRSRNDHALVPDSLSVIGPPEVGDGLVSEYFDSRGVRRTYGASLDGGVLRFWRGERGFDQRFAAVIGPERFEGLWELAREPGAWRDDLRVSYRRAAG